MKTQLCICNECNTVMVDENPSDQPEFETDGYNVMGMAHIDDEGYLFWVCPVCMVDDNLMDVDYIEQLDHVKDILK